MDIRGVIKPRKGSHTTVASGSIATAPAVTPTGVPRVTVFVNTLDHHGISNQLARIEMSPAEARTLASGLLHSADRAEVSSAEYADTVERVRAAKNGG